MATLERRDLGNGRVLYTTPKCEVEVAQRGGNVLFVRYKGYVTMDLLSAIQADTESHLKQLGTIQLFVDSTGLDGYDPGFREAWAERFKQFGGRVTGFILLRSPLVKMTLRFVNLISGQERAALEPLSDRADFERRLQAAIATGPKSTGAS
jgi:hypothetical protein